MMGIRATSGSVASRLRNVVIASTESSRSASMLTSRTFAPPRTCSSATSTASWNWPPSIRRRKRAEPVTFVRSPTMTKFDSGKMRNGSRPLRRVSLSPPGTRLGVCPSVAAVIAFTCSGVVPQQPPTMFTSPSCANPRSA